MNNTKKIFVCASINLSNSERINNQAIALGKILGMRDVTYVQGGSAQGLMGLTLKEFIKYSNNVEFIVPDVYYSEDVPMLSSVLGEDNLRVEKVHGEGGRLNAIKECDHILVLPGGTGTIEELLYCNETSRAKEHNSKITLVNIDGYYDAIIQQINIGINVGLIKQSAIKFEVINDVNELELDK